MGPILMILVSLIYESPVYMLTKSRYDEARVIFRKIASKNGAKLPAIFKFKKEVQEEMALSDSEDVADSQTASVMDIFRSRRLALNMFIAINIFLAASFNFYLIAFYVKYIKGNVFSNTILS